jgi:hypothetical protein
MVIKLVNGHWICKTPMRCYAFIQLANVIVAVVNKWIFVCSNNSVHLLDLCFASVCEYGGWINL